MFGTVLKKGNHIFKEKKQAKEDKKWKQSADRLQGSQFRLLNEFLYTQQSKTIMEHFQNNPTDFNLYHEGFTSQQEKWPENPINNIIKLINESAQFEEESLIIADLGCGDGKLQQFFQEHKKQNIKKIYSYDLISTKDYIIQADIANVPLGDKSCNVAIFSLSLMGTNYLDFLGEAFRILKTQGYLIIAEVKSRMDKIDHFVNLVSGMGFKILKRDEHNTHFALFVFQKTSNVCKFNGPLTSQRVKQIMGENLQFDNWKDLGQAVLKPCIYKKR